MKRPFEPTENHCPHCFELLGAGKIHICPIGCCYVGIGQESMIVTCPLCENSFETQNGHVCLELLRLSEPAQ